MKLFFGIEGPLGLSMQQMARVFLEENFCQLVDFSDEADLIIVGDKMCLHRLYSQEKHFVITSIENPGNLPSNCRWIRITELLVNILSYINEINYSVSVSDKSEITCIETSVRYIPHDKEWVKNVLVIDDNHENLKLALELLSDDHCVTLASGYNEGKKLIWENKYDVVLSDCQMPAEIEKSALSVHAVEIGGVVHNGLFLMFFATARGARFAIVTDANHHHDWVSAIFDELHGPQIVNGQPVLFINYMEKRWDEALEKLMSL